MDTGVQRIQKKMNSKYSNVSPPAKTTTPAETTTPADTSKQVETTTPAETTKQVEKTKQVEPQPALRVTAPPSKNEKKAAARKAKSERLERELAEAKEALRDPAFVADPPAPEAAPEEAPIRDKKQEGSMLYLGALVAAVGGLIY